MKKNKVRQFRMRRWLADNRARLDVLLAALLVLQLNILAARYPQRVDISRDRHFALSSETRLLLDRLPGEIKLIVFLEAGHELARYVHHLLLAYAHAGPLLKVEFVDPHRDLARSKELALHYDVREANIIVLDTGTRARQLPIADLVDDEEDLPRLARRARVQRLFRGEPVLSNALRNLTQQQRKVVYFLTGHGERRLDDFDPLAGYSVLARQLIKRELTVKPLSFSGLGAVPADADCLVIAGPVHPIVLTEAEMIQAYLNNSGRVCLLADVGRQTGLESLLEQWGVRLAPERIIGSAADSQQLLVSTYGEHPVTERLFNVTTVFTMPRYVQPLGAQRPEDEKELDRPRVAVLAACGEQGWVERTAGQNPPVFDPDIDLRGPAAVAVAVERGPSRDLTVGLRPTRLIVIGDSSLASNAALLRGQNAAFFINALDWLLDYDDPLAIERLPPAKLQVSLDRTQPRWLAMVFVGGGPLLALALGSLILLRRRL